MTVYFDLFAKVNVFSRCSDKSFVSITFFIIRAHKCIIANFIFLQTTLNHIWHWLIRVVIEGPIRVEERKMKLGRTLAVITRIFIFSYFSMDTCFSSPRWGFLFGIAKASSPLFNFYFLFTPWPTNTSVKIRKWWHEPGCE